MGKIPSIMFIFDRKKVATHTVEAPVTLSLCHNRKQIWRNTGVKVCRDQWDDRLWVVNHAESMRLNAILRGMMKNVNQWLSDIIDRGEEFSFEKFDAWWKGHPADSPEQAPFIEWLATTIEKRTDIRGSTRRQHEVMADVVIQFGGLKSFADLTPENIMRFDEWLHREGRTQVTVHGYHKRLKTYINLAIQRRQWDGRNPYDFVKIQRGVSKPRAYLLESELRLMAKTDFGNEMLNNARDLFVFQSLTGLSYVELSHFDFKRDVEVSDDGRYILKNRRTKTEVDFMTIIGEDALAILERHDYKLPMVSNTKYNMYLKPIGTMLKLDKVLTTHSARHTFAVTALNRGVAIEVVAKILGHTNIRTTQIYAKIVGESVLEAFDKIGKIL